MVAHDDGTVDIERGVVTRPINLLFNDPCVLNFVIMANIFSTILEGQKSASHDDA
jgi:hypothetical protein